MKNIKIILATFFLAVLFIGCESRSSICSQKEVQEKIKYKAIEPMTIDMVVENKYASGKYGIPSPIDRQVTRNLRKELGDAGYLNLVFNQKCKGREKEIICKMHDELRNMALLYHRNAKLDSFVAKENGKCLATLTYTDTNDNNKTYSYLVNYEVRKSDDGKKIYAEFKSLKPE